jgi:hypothetical protein
MKTIPVWNTTGLNAGALSKYDEGSRRMGYCPINKKTGFWGGGSRPDCAGAALNGARRSVTSVSGVLVAPEEVELVVVLTMATEPPSHKLAYTRLLSAAATADMRKRAVAGE